MKKILKAIHTAEGVFSAVTLGLMTVVTFTAAFNRFTFKIPMPWSEELVRFLLLWCSIIAGALGISTGAHVGIDVVTSRLSDSAQNVIRRITSIAAIVLMYIIFKYGLQMTISGFNQTSPALQLKMGWVFMCLPVGAGLMAMEFVIIFIDTFRKKNVEKE